MSPRFERLSPQDASFLYMESPVAHMHVGALAIIDDSTTPMEEIYRHIERRLDLVPRFRKKLQWVPYQQGRPVWVDDPDFDIRFHVRHTGLPRPGGESELLDLMARIQSIPLDRSRPLWEEWIVDLPDNRRALIQKTHHALVDGISGVDLATVLLDATPDSPEIPTEGWVPTGGPTPNELLFESLVERVSQPAELWRSFRAATRTPRRILADAVEAGRGVVELAGSGLTSAPTTSLAAPVGRQRRFEIVRTSLADVKAVKARVGGSVNDVVLTIVSGGLRHLLVERGDDVEGLELRALIPVSVRPDGGRMTFGNKVSGMFARLPIGIAHPIERLEAMRDEMIELKAGKEVLGAETIMRAADYAPPTLLALAGRAMSSSKALNLTVTNVPGPQMPLYFRGGEMLEAFPYVPLTTTTTVGVAVLSYNGQLNFGLVGDWATTPDLPVLAEGIEKSLAELRP